VSRRTIFLSKLIGWYCILGGIGMMVRPRSTLATVAAMLQSGPMLVILAAVCSAAGIAMVLAHNVWKGGGLPVVVTIVGWLVLIKAALFFVLTPEMEVNLFMNVLRYEQLFYEYMAFSIILGIYLTYGGYTSKAEAE
jgi:hypothetical protein